MSPAYVQRGVSDTLKLLGLEKRAISDDLIRDVLVRAWGRRRPDHLRKTVVDEHPRIFAQEPRAFEGHLARTLAEATRELEEGFAGLRQELANDAAKEFAGLRQEFAKRHAKAQVLRQASAPQRPQTPVATSAPVVGSPAVIPAAPSASVMGSATKPSSAPTSNLRRNLTLGAAVVLPTLAYTAYRHFTKTPQTEGAHAAGKTAMLRTLGF